MEENASLLGNLADLFHRLNDANFVAGVHDRDQNRLVCDRIPKLIQIDQSVLSHWQVRDTYAILLKTFARIQNSLMLGSLRDDVVATLGVHFSNTLQS